jgi:predicted dehydrogenase
MTRRELLSTAAGGAAALALGAAPAVGAVVGADPTEPKKLAFIGTAHIHAPDFINRVRNRKDVKCVGVYDHDPKRAARDAAKLGCPAVADYADILKDPELAAVLICSETNRHEELIIAAATAKKNIYAEKPLGLGARDAFAIRDAVEKAGVLFSTGYFMRSDAVNLFLRDEIKTNAFGTITRVRKSNCHNGSLGHWFDGEYRWMADLKQAGVGGYGDLGTHALDILMWWFGDPLRVTASIHAVTHHYDDTDEFGEGILEFDNGVVATLAAGWLDLTDPWTTLISGTEGYAYQSGGFHFKSQKVQGTPPMPPGKPHAFDMFLDAVCGKTDAALVTVREAAARAAVMESLYQAARDHTWVVPPK